MHKKKKLIVGKFAFVLIFSTFYFLVSSTSFAQVEIATPSIAISPDIYYPQDEIIYLEGKAEPNSTLEINFQKQGIKPINLSARSDARGEWVLAEKVPMEEGDWQVRVRVVKFDGEVSMWSNPRVVKAIATGLVIGGVTLKFSVLVFSMLVIFFVSLVLVLFFYSRMRKFQLQTQELRIQDLQKELQQKKEAMEKLMLSKNKEETQTLLEQEFRSLKDMILQELRHIESLSGERVLTSAEEEHKDHLVRQLDEIESKIGMSIKGIEISS